MRISCKSRPPKRALTDAQVPSDLMPRKLLRSPAYRISHKALAQRSCTASLEQDTISLAKGLVPLLWRELLWLGSLARIFVDSVFSLRHLIKSHILFFSLYMLLTGPLCAEVSWQSHASQRNLLHAPMFGSLRNRNNFKFWSFKSWKNI